MEPNLSGILLELKLNKMKKLFKYIKIVLLTVASLLALVIFLAFFGEGIANWWRMVTYTHPDEVAGISIGDKKKDLIFKHGKGEQNGNRIYYKDLEASFSIDPLGKIDVITFAPDKRNTKYSYHLFPIFFVEDLETKFGEPNIYSSSKNHLERRYTYSSDGLTTGVTYSFKQNKITDIMIGNITWRKHFEAGDYVVNGTVFCPGSKCPFNDEGIKPEWQDKSVRELIGNN